MTVVSTPVVSVTGGTVDDVSVNTSIESVGSAVSVGSGAVSVVTTPGSGSVSVGGMVSVSESAGGSVNVGMPVVAPPSSCCRSACNRCCGSYRACCAYGWGC